MTTPQRVLVLNAGSSSLKFQVVDPSSGEASAKGLIERVGASGSTISLTVDGEEHEAKAKVPDQAAALELMRTTLAERGVDLASCGLVAVGHRVVHGGRKLTEPTVVDRAVLAEIDRAAKLAPLHNPANADGIRNAAKAFPELPQVAVFDTAFFSELPPAASTYAIDHRLAEKHAIRRYGFHGTSHEYVSQEAASFLGRDVTEIDQIVLHLGNGASASAIRGGLPVDTSMGLTPLEGLVMGTRGGDVDPGVLLHLHRVAGLDVSALDALLNKKSGVQGIAGISDFRDLTTAADEGDEKARLALDVYLHRLRKYVGAYLAVLGGADVITFTAGVGENSAVVRAGALKGLERLGIRIDGRRNKAKSRQARIISTDSSDVTVLVVPTNEELAIARQSLAAIHTLVE
ncbi:acetate kinase [Luteipulveratus mongoliensis]|uniref:Acetate kinase n=1 Tax=Luteipulveratus mongoliensis TaxID=571913 RepID=A0A0K1JNQ7_9MICO|nr:acetate kinase [Luteipulveratus mongoliensis]AKU18359.1 acetate kinase [Luteipulveratus mongoliensis]